MIALASDAATVDGVVKGVMMVVVLTAIVVMTM